MNLRRLMLTGGAVMVLGAGFLLGRLGPPGASLHASTLTDHASAAARPSFEADAQAGGAPVISMPDFRMVAKKVIPSVVTVRSQKTVRVSQRGFPFGDDFFQQFFGGGAPRGREPREQRYTQHGLGSGVVVSNDGYVLTNNHVVEGVDKVEVVGGDGKAHPAKILGTDPQTDIAVLKVASLNLPALPMGDSDDLDVGEWVLAVGNPFSEALGHTVTAGIVSAKGRSNLHLADYEDFIQTDAAINPGNSGGALVNTRGQLVGINAAIISESGGYQGIGFAIPIDMARSVMDQLIKSGKVVRGYLGISIQDLTPDLADSLGLTGRDGAIVAEVTSGSPAADAGVKRGDVITAVNGQKVSGNAELRNRIASTAPGTKATLTIVRDGKEREISVVLGEHPESEGGAPGGGRPSSEESLGLTVQPLTAQLADRLGYDGEKGVVVTEVEGGGPADEAGLQRGDLIKEVNRKPVSSVSEYQQALGSVAQGKVVLFLVRRGDSVIYVTLKP